MHYLFTRTQTETMDGIHKSITKRVGKGLTDVIVCSDVEDVQVHMKEEKCPNEEQVTNKHDQKDLYEGSYA